MRQSSGVTGANLLNHITHQGQSPAVQQRTSDTSVRLANRPVVQLSPTPDYSVHKGLQGEDGPIPGSDNDPSVASSDTPLPFQKDSWDGEQILSNLGQYDHIEVTDSDGGRCVPAAVLAASIIKGPFETTAYLINLSNNIQTQAGGWEGLNARKQAAMVVLTGVIARIMEKIATYGDLSWAQEAIHALYVTKEGDRVEGVSDDKAIGMANAEGSGAWRKAAEGGTAIEPSQQQLVAMIKGLDEGGQMLLVKYTKYVGSDTEYGHQYLVYKEGGKAKLYNPAESNGKVRDALAEIPNFFTRTAHKESKAGVLGSR
ncbi:MAG: hypothetical protein AAFS10_00700 [Myxococcota bacterium]